jgi:exodeoxyribonuclease VII small subunit
LKTDKINTESFEESFLKLEEILDKLENKIDDFSLDQLLEMYNEGMNFIKVCKKKLTEAELKIEKINLKGNN